MPLFDSSPSRPNWFALAASVVAHAILLIALLSAAPDDRRGAKPPSRRREGVAAIMTLPPKAPPNYVLAPIVTAAPAPALRLAALPEQSTAADPAVPTSPQVPDEVDETDDIIGRIHANWLEPPSFSKSFHCRIHIDYAAGGMIVAVRFLQGCGSLELDDSVKRAIWKTQPLPLLGAKNEAGSLEIDFTP
jgi:membrane protein involved in colicin uptake